MTGKRNIKRRMADLEKAAAARESLGNWGPIILVEQEPGETEAELDARAKQMCQQRIAAGRVPPTNGGVRMVIVRLPGLPLD